MGQAWPFFTLFGPERRRTFIGPELIPARSDGAAHRGDMTAQRIRGRNGAAQGDDGGDRFPLKVLALCHLLAGKASPLSSSPSSLFALGSRQC